MEEKIKELEEKNTKLEHKLQAIKEHLKKYTAPASKNFYYEQNKLTHILGILTMVSLWSAKYHIGEIKPKASNQAQ